MFSFDFSDGSLAGRFSEAVRFYRPIELPERRLITGKLQSAFCCVVSFRQACNY